MPMGPMGPAGLQVELSAASSSSSSDGEGPWGAGSGASQALCPGGRSGAAGAQPAGAPAASAQPSGGGGSAPAGAQARAALFEALVRANTETVITCAHSGDAADGSAAGGAGRSSSGNGAGVWTAEERGGGAGGGAQQALVLSALPHQEGQEYSEVQLVLRVPRWAPPPAPPPRRAAADSALGVQGIELREQSHEEALLSTIEKLKAEVVEKERLRRLAAEATSRKAQECESLARVVRELTESRAKLVGGRAALAERVAALQHEFLRVVRIADLSRAASKDNLEKASRAGRLAKQAEEEAARQRRLAAALRERLLRARAKAAELDARVRLLERVEAFARGRESAGLRGYARGRFKETF